MNSAGMGELLLACASCYCALIYRSGPIPGTRYRPRAAAPLFDQNQGTILGWQTYFGWPLGVWFLALGIAVYLGAIIMQLMTAVTPLWAAEKEGGGAPQISQWTRFSPWSGVGSGSGIPWFCLRA
ncbi:MAG: hypothetical protein CM15mP25_5600 [Gammaproteobacteria bacterium]|nr:MAG: hypothetical protein CM15mP25_5600 [Gammaproteobacteria bacterium]